MKTTVAETIKPALLLSPHRLLETNIVVQTLRIIRGHQSLNYEVGDMNSSELKALFPGWPKEVAVLFREFSRDAIDFVKKEIKQRHSKQKSGTAWQGFFRQAMLRHYHQLLESAKPFATLVKWYHTKQLNGNKHYSTAPCQFSAYRPQLQFEVIKEGERLHLQTGVVINGSSYPLTAFYRHEFLLESRNEYFLLSFKDYQTLDWLRDQRPEQYIQPAELAQQVLAHLEKDYPVNRNNLFDQQQIIVKPVNRVMLSELSNTFLMLTPQWTYDGFVLEGPWQETVDLVQNGEAYSIARDREAEQQFLQLLESLHPNFPKQRNGYYYLSFADAQKKQWFLKTYHHLLVSDIELLGMDMLRHFRYSSYKAETQVKVLEEEESKVVLNISVCFGKEEIPIGELQKMLLPSTPRLPSLSTTAR